MRDLHEPPSSTPWPKFSPLQSILQEFSGNPITASSATFAGLGKSWGVGILRAQMPAVNATNPFLHPSLYLNLPPAFLRSCAPENSLKFSAASLRWNC